MKYFGYLALFAILLAAGCTSEAPSETQEETPIVEEIEETTTEVEEETPLSDEVTEETPVDEPEETPVDYSGTITTGNYANCLEKCTSGPGSGPYCEDGCRFEQAENTKNLTYCDQLDQKDNIPECYGTVAIAIGDITICDKLTNTEDHNHCVAAFLPR